MLRSCMQIDWLIVIRHTDAFTWEGGCYYVPGQAVRVAVGTPAPPQVTPVPVHRLVDCCTRFIAHKLVSTLGAVACFFYGACICCSTVFVLLLVVLRLKPIFVRPLVGDLLQTVALTTHAPWKYTTVLHKHTLCRLLPTYSYVLACCNMPN